jgi:hypothetical protein
MSASHRVNAASLLLLALAAGCSTALYQTSTPFSAPALARLRQGGAALGCHERSAELFQLFLFCPGSSRRTLGIAHAEGKLQISCPDLGRLACRKLFERVQRAAPER